jgi:uncharacterized protein YkwD
MHVRESFLPRREFLKTAVLGFSCSWGARGSLASIPATATNLLQLSDSDIAAIRVELLNLANAERTKAGTGRIELDQLACTVATEHAKDMASGGFLSHWGSDGQKPYHRYAFAGGFNGVAENVSGAENIAVGAKEIAGYLVEMHETMHDETPPNDGHRQTILGPHHTHAGFGFARNARSLRLVELYVAKYVEISPFQPPAKRKSSFALNGKLLNTTHTIQQVDVCYEPLPARPETVTALDPRSYGLPDDYVTLRPRLAGRPGYSDGSVSIYTDGSRGDIELAGGKFRVFIKLYKELPGIYTIVFWIRRTRGEKAFPATNICLRVE